MLTLQALCLFDALGDDFADRLNDFLHDDQNHEDLDFDEPPTRTVLRFARDLAIGAWFARARADELLAAAVPGWSVQRMAPVDRNILRLGLFELLSRPETPFQVVINEAVELARRFGDAETPAFVNGVLDGIRRRNENATPDGAAPDAPPPAGEPADTVDTAARSNDTEREADDGPV